MPSRSSYVRARTPLRRRGSALALGMLLVGAFLLAGAQVSEAQPAGASGAQAAGATVDIVEADGILDNTVADYLVEVLETAAADGSVAVVLQLDLRGSIGGAAERVVSAMTASEVPVVTWVGPPGAHATGGGLLVAQAGHLRAAAPGTLLGPAAPVDLNVPDRPGDWSRYEDTTGLAAAEVAPLLDAGAIAIAPSEGDQTLPEDAALPPGIDHGDVTVLDEAAAVDGALLDLTASSLAVLLPDLQGREVVAGDGTLVTLDIDPATATPRFNNLGIVRQVLHAVAHPALAYLLLVAGALALLFEVFQPGFGVAGVSGILTGVLGLYGFVVLPARPLALVLVLVGLLLLAGDLALGRLGLLTAAGTGAFVAGSWWLLPGPEPLTLPWWVVALVTVTAVVFFVGVMTTVLRAQGNQALAGAEHVVGEAGVVRSMLNPEGHVFVGGALWRARAPDEAGRVKAGTRVRVLGLTDSLTLDVVPLEEGEEDEQAAAEPPSPSSVR